MYLIFLALFTYNDINHRSDSKKLFYLVSAGNDNLLYSIDIEN